MSTLEFRDAIRDALAEELERDPIALLRARLQKQHGVEEQALDTLERQTQEEINHAIDAALAAPYPDPRAQQATEYAP